MFSSFNNEIAVERKTSSILNPNAQCFELPEKKHKEKFFQQLILVAVGHIKKLETQHQVQTEENHLL
jgi:hypothetical protein